MGQMLIDVLFTVLNFIANIFLSPIAAAINTVFPALTAFFTSVTTFIGYGLTYISFFVKLLMIPTAPLVALVGFFVGIFAFNLTLRVVGLGMAVYKWFKP